MTKVIYPECAAAFGVTKTQVESGIKHAIESGFAKAPKNYKKIFKYNLQKPPINSQFISKLSELFRVLF